MWAPMSSFWTLKETEYDLHFILRVSQIFGRTLIFSFKLKRIHANSSEPFFLQIFPVELVSGAEI